MLGENLLHPDSMGCFFLQSLKQSNHHATPGPVHLFCSCSPHFWPLCKGSG
jgi:hypothetical protein